MCGESYSEPREVWLQCQMCKFGAHEACTAGGGHFVCPNCDSDGDIDLCSSTLTIMIYCKGQAAVVNT